jgi:hypothetical protein
MLLIKEQLLVNTKAERKEDFKKLFFFWCWLKKENQIHSTSLSRNKNSFCNRSSITNFEVLNEEE